jgi:hypothetical protein
MRNDPLIVLKAMRGCLAAAEATSFTTIVATEMDAPVALA